MQTRKIPAGESCEIIHFALWKALYGNENGLFSQVFPESQMQLLMAFQCFSHRTQATSAILDSMILDPDTLQSVQLNRFFEGKDPGNSWFHCGSLHRSL